MLGGGQRWGEARWARKWHTPNEGTSLGDSEEAGLCEGTPRGGEARQAGWGAHRARETPKIPPPDPFYRLTLSRHGLTRGFGWGLTEWSPGVTRAEPLKQIPALPTPVHLESCWEASPPFPPSLRVAGSIPAEPGA